MDLLKIISAQYISDYWLSVEFNTGEKRRMDFSEIIRLYPVFQPLQDVEVFKNFVLTDTLEWLDGKIDIAPEFILEHGL